MKFKDIVGKKKEELSGVIKEKQARLRSLSFDLSSGKVKNVREIRALKKDIARILTFLNQHE